MADQTSNSAARESPATSRDEIDALSQVIAATIAMAVRTRSVAASALLERALATLKDRVRTMEEHTLEEQQDGGGRDGFRPS